MSATTSSSSRNGADTCMWTQGERCRTPPRSCRDCLDRTNDNCGISAIGACVSQSTTATAHSPTHFAARNAAYCPIDDAVCSRCVAQWLATIATNASSILTATCVGANGCVCFAACELPNWEARVRNAAQCISHTNSSLSIDNATIAVPTADGTAAPSALPASSASTTPTTGQVLLAGAICFAAVLVFAAISLGLGKLVRKMDQSAIRYRRDRFLTAFRLPQRPRTGPTLELMGWTTMREQLVQDGTTTTAAAVSSAVTLAPPIAYVPAYAQPQRSDVLRNGRSDGAANERALWIHW